MRAAREGSITVHCDPVIIAEPVYVLTSQYGASRAKTVDALERVLKPRSTIMPDKQRYLRALKIFGRTNIHFGDACACALALEHCEGRLVSFGCELSNVPGVRRFESLQDGR